MPTSTTPLATGRAGLARRVAAAFAVALVVSLAWRLGVLDRVREPGALARDLAGLGPIGYLAFVGVYAALQPFGVPGTVLVVAAPLVWPWHVAFGLSMTGTMGACVVGFSFARFVGRDFATARIPARFRRYDEALARRAFTTVFFLRFTFGDSRILTAFFGLSRVPFWTHVWGSLAGRTIPLLLVSYFGARLVDWLKNASPLVWAGLVAAIAAAAAVTWGVQRRRLAADLEEPGSPG